MNQHSTRNWVSVWCGLATLVATLPGAAEPTASAALPDASQPIVRETRTVKLGKTVERWSLVWRKPPAPACRPDDELGSNGWSTCGCTGFAFGERGEVDLVRERQGQDPEVLPLTPFFKLDVKEWKGTAILPHWPVKATDSESASRDSDAFVKKLHARPAVEIMRLGDYDHDGQATEFVLQTGTWPCGKRFAIVVGVSPQEPRLHAFGTAEHPSFPLELLVAHWEALARSREATSGVEWECGDHGSKQQTAVELRTDAQGIHAATRIYGCKDDMTRGELVETIPR